MNTGIIRLIAIIVLIAITVWGLAFLLYTKHSKMNTHEVFKVIHSPVIHSRVDGTDLATKQVITSNAATLLRIRTDSLEIRQLQKLVKSLSKQPGSAAAVINTITTVDTVIQIIHDSIPGSFHQEINNRWLDAKIRYDGHNAAGLDLHVKNEYPVVFNTRKDSTFVQVHSLNPYTSTTGISAFQVPTPPRKKGAFWIGLAAGIVGGYFLHH